MEIELNEILVATLTPFTASYELDEAGLRRLIRRVAPVDGINGIVCNAGAGEGATLTRDERIRCIEIVREETNKPVIAGIEALSTREAVQQVTDARDAGASAVMLTPPHVYDWNCAANPEFALRYFHDIATAVEIPITIFHYPPSTGTGYTVATAVQIAREIDSVVAIKVAGGGLVRRYEQVLRGMRGLPRRVAVLATSSLFQHFLTGGDGALTGFANFAPEFCVELFRAVRSGQLERARGLHDINYALEAAVYKDPNVYKHTRYKVAAHLAGILDNMVVRPPQIPVPAGDVELIRNALAQLDFIPKK